MNIISYIYNAEDGELNLTITVDPPDEDGTKEVHESILGDFVDDADVRLTCLNVAKSHELWPAYFVDDPKVTGRRGGKTHSDSLTPQQRSERARNAARRRWDKS